MVFGWALKIFLGAMFNVSVLNKDAWEKKNGDFDFGGEDPARAGLFNGRFIFDRVEPKD